MSGFCFRVGMTGFEPATPSSRTKYATGLRYIPKNRTIVSYNHSKLTRRIGATRFVRRTGLPCSTKLQRSWALHPDFLCKTGKSFHYLQSVGPTGHQPATISASSPFLLSPHQIIPVNSPKPTQRPDWGNVPVIGVGDHTIGIEYLGNLFLGPIS